MKNKTNKKELILWALKHSFLKLSPKEQIKNPVMFITYLGAILTTLICLKQVLNGHSIWFEGQITLWLWFTVLFANFAESLAEGKGKAQAESLKEGRKEIYANLICASGTRKELSSNLRKGDMVLCEAGDIIPADGEVIKGIASVDESAITGESAPVIRESGGDRSAVTGGTRVISDCITISITSEPGESFMERMIALIESSSRQKTPNELALSLLLCGLTVLFLAAVISLKFFAGYINLYDPSGGGLINITVLTGLLICLIPTTIGGLLSAIGIAGINRLFKLNVVATSGRAVEAAGDIDVLLLDKTGTITLGNRMAAEFIAAPGIDLKNTAACAQLSSIADETPEGRSVVVLAKNQFNLRAEKLEPGKTVMIPFTAQTQMSGIDICEQGRTRSIRKGSVEAISRLMSEKYHKQMPEQIIEAAAKISRRGGTPLAVIDNDKIMGLIHLKDVVKGGIKERFAELRQRGIRTVMITGDNPLTAAAIAAEAGVDDFMASATPEAKLERIRSEQAQGHLVAMTGDGTNDAPALAQADVGVSMNTGTQAAREAGNMVDLESNPTKVIEIVETGKQMLITRGALTTFSIANDVAKYFAIIPAIFAGVYASVPGGAGPLHALNIMHLSCPQSAILSAVIFNALIIVALIPLALRGIKTHARSAKQLLLRNVLIYGVGGLVAPFIGIKLIDMLITFTGICKGAL